MRSIIVVGLLVVVVGASSSASADETSPAVKACQDAYAKESSDPSGAVSRFESCAASAVVADRCEATRSARIAKAQADVKAWAQRLMRLADVRKRARAGKCHDELRTVPGEIETVRQGDAWVTRPLKMNVVVCSARPAGATDDDIRQSLSLEEELPMMLDLHPRTCESLDTAAGLPPLNVAHNDAEGLKRIASIPTTR